MKITFVEFLPIQREENVVVVEEIEEVHSSNRACLHFRSDSAPECINWQLRHVQDVVMKR